MKKIDHFINQYSLSKTLRFSLIPVGKTEENFEKKMLLQEDEKRAADYVEIKQYIDEYHKFFIQAALSKVQLEGVPEYAELYYAKRTDATIKKMKQLEEKMRKRIVAGFKEEDNYTNLFKGEMIKKLLPEYYENEKEKLEIIGKFFNFTTYFTGFQDNRKNIYTDEEKSTGVAFRSVNDNLPKYLDNIKTYRLIKEYLKEELVVLSDKWEKEITEVSADLDELEQLFSEYTYSYFLTQFAIDRYNGVIGDINKSINLYSQKNHSKLPLFKPLFKQILSDREVLSFVPEKFRDDNELLNALKTFYKGSDEVSALEETLVKINELFQGLEEVDLAGVYYLNKGAALTDLSKTLTGDWATIQNQIYEEYDQKNPKKAAKADEKYFDERKKYLKSFKSIELKTIQEYAGKDIKKYYAETVEMLVDQIKNEYEKAKDLIEKEYKESRRLYKNDEAIGQIKDFLDSVKKLERQIKPLEGTGKEESKDELFYGQFLLLLEQVQTVDRLYDKVRNYLTQKPYSKDKIKLNFENPQFLGGWDKNKEADYRSVILKDQGKYYLAIMDKNNSKSFSSYPYDNGKEFLEKMEYKLLPGPNKMLPKVFFAKSNIGFFNPSDKILSIRKNETFKKGSNFKIKDCHDLIDFYKESIDKHEDWSKFGFRFKDTKEYADISEFYREIQQQGYSVTFNRVNKEYVNDLVENGSLYLFQIYNKDFSEYSKGTPNLHTLYFRMLFDPDNLKNVVFKLNGEAEMFYRKASIRKEEQVIHPAKKALKNKNPNNPKKESVFEYDLIKDKRFTKRNFALHLPITLNFKAEGQVYLNGLVRKEIAESEDNYIIGIDRGERNLLYVCVINSAGKIVEQYSLNEIINEHNGVKYSTDYRQLLDMKEKEREKARQNWTAVENIKELKEGYLSQVIRKICDLVVKYDAIIAMEDLNSGFKNNRIKVEKQVYQKFEKQLVEKLRFLVDKKAPTEENGGLLKAFQLTNADPKYIGKVSQNGIIFYVPAWLTSKIDPVTGFVDLLKPKYISEVEAKEFISKFRFIEYCEQEDMFAFSFRYSDFPRGTTSFKDEWTIYTNGERIRTFRNPMTNNEWDNETINLTEQFKELFGKAGIEYRNNLKEQILEQKGKDFYKALINNIALILQMRNSITGNVEVDYMISPVKNDKGVFYDSRDYENLDQSDYPQNADANGAYNIARKAQMLVEMLKEADDEERDKMKLTIKNRDWLEFAQSNE